MAESWFHRHRRLLFWLFGLLVVVTVLAVGLGLGLGLDHHVQDLQQASGSSTSPAITSSALTLVTTAITSSALTLVTTAITTSLSTKASSERQSTTATSSSLTSSTLTATSSTPTPSSSLTSSITSTSTSIPLSSVATTTPSNPVATSGTPQFLGNVTSTNTFDIRDLGWQGNIGSTYINTYGDTIPCSGIEQAGCFGLEAPNSATIPDSPTLFTDLDLNAKGNHAQIFCPLIDGEKASFGLGLTNVVQISETEGVVFFLRNNRTAKPSYIAGAGVAAVTTGGGKIVCTRPSLYWWDSETEPYYGDHGAILAPDGYIYAYGGKGSVGGGSALFLTRVPQQLALDLNAYEYWNGTAFSSSRLYNPTMLQTVLQAGQGSIIYSPYYRMYLYFKPGCPGGSCILVQAADRPEGPWSSTYGVWGTGDSPDGFLMYAPAVQPKWSDAEMRHVVLMYTGRGNGFGNILQAINVTFS